MKTCRKSLALILLALTLGVPVWAGDMNSTPTAAPTPPPPSPNARCVASTNNCTRTENTAPSGSNCCGNVQPSAGFDAASIAIQVLRKMLSLY